MGKPYNPYNIEPAFKEYLEVNNFSRTTVLNYLADLRTFVSWFNARLETQQLPFDLQYLSSSAIERYKGYLIEKHTPVKSINRSISTMRTFIKFCIDKDWIESNQIGQFSNIKGDTITSIKYKTISALKSTGLFSLGFVSILLLFLLPGLFIMNNRQNSTPDSLLLQKDFTVYTGNTSASTSGELLTIPIIDQKGNLNLNAPYPKIIGSSGILSLEAPGLSLTSQDKGNVSLTVKEGSMQFLFEGLIPPLPYEAAFYFSSRELDQGTLIKGQTIQTGSDINLLELSSGVPAETKFKVDADGNVYIKGNIVLDGNLIVNPGASIFGRVSDSTATSSFSPNP